MKKILCFLALSMSILLKLNAGYVIRGIDVTAINYDNLKNYTLSFDGSGNPISAATMNANFVSGSEKNCIVIIRENTPAATIFPIQLSPEPYFLDIQIRDFQNVEEDCYAICGSVQINSQIYSITGQLVQTGTTNPEISTAQLTKGMYILRLENKKAIKFVK